MFQLQYFLTLHFNISLDINNVKHLNLGSGRRCSLEEGLIKLWPPERTKAEGGAWMKEAGGDLHFRITGESDKCWNNSLSY